jgi:UDP-GlcNAc:undecaprenyl-phosphate GlcNAc-1-phosphate transferase
MLALPMALALFGAIAGFIPYNRNPAMIFMGDSGSMFIGFILSLLSISSIRHENSLYAMVVPIYLLFVPIMDMGMSILRRIASRKPIMAPDKQHFHHQLKKRLSSHIAVVIVLSLVQILFSAIGILVFISKEFKLGLAGLAAVVLITSVYTVITSIKSTRSEKQAEALLNK